MDNHSRKGQVMAQKALGKAHRKGITLAEVFKMYPDDASAEKAFAARRWPHGIACPHCGDMDVQEGTAHPEMPYRCRGCKKFFSVKTGTVMQGSKIGYQGWLIAMYSLTHLSSDRRVSLFIDEPDNYLALGEIQPWLAEAEDRVGDSLGQVVVASHHPVTIDYMAGASGRWFSRDGNGPVRVSKEPKNVVDGLSLSETMARRWE